MNYEDMPLRGKISPKAWEFENTGRWEYGETTRRYKRKLHRHYNPYKDWWVGCLHNKWRYNGPSPSKGHKRKTWKDYRYGPER
jgi:hypothetical protein